MLEHRTSSLACMACNIHEEAYNEGSLRQDFYNQTVQWEDHDGKMHQLTHSF